MAGRSDGRRTGIETKFAAVSLQHTAAMNRLGGVRGHGRLSGASPGGINDQAVIDLGGGSRGGTGADATFRREGKLACLSFESMLSRELRDGKRVSGLECLLTITTLLAGFMAS